MLQSDGGYPIIKDEIDMIRHFMSVAAVFPALALSGQTPSAQDTSMSFFISIDTAEGNVSWNAAYNSRGCAQEDLAKTGGASL